MEPPANRTTTTSNTSKPMAPPPLPAPNEEAYVEHEGARIWYASYGTGAPVILLHGGLGHSGNWGYQLPALLGAGHRVVSSTVAATVAAPATHGPTATN